jgi:AraC-like DNA-binding protein
MAALILEEGRLKANWREVERLISVLEYIEANLDAPLERKNLAQLSYLSVSRFAVLFRTVLGVSPADYVREVKLQRGQSLLLSTTLTVVEIAKQCGFKSEFHFSRLLKRALAPALLLSGSKEAGALVASTNLFEGISMMNRIFQVLIALCLLLSQRNAMAQPNAAPMLLGDITAAQHGFNAGVAANRKGVVTAQHPASRHAAHVTLAQVLTPQSTLKTNVPSHKEDFEGSFVPVAKTPGSVSSVVGSIPAGWTEDSSWSGANVKINYTNSLPAPLPEKARFVSRWMT